MRDAIRRPALRRPFFVDRWTLILGGSFVVLAILVDVGLLARIDQWSVDHIMPALRPRSVPRSVGASLVPTFHAGRDTDVPLAAAVYGVAWIASALPALVLTAAGCVYLYLRRSTRLALGLAFAFVAVGVVELVGKYALDRPALYGSDPRGVRVEVVPFVTSFPSGHAARAVILVAVVWLCMARLRVPALVWLAAVLVLLVVGAWHTPTDVLGAVLLAGAFAVPLIRGADRISSRASSDPPLQARPQSSTGVNG